MKNQVKFLVMAGVCAATIHLQAADNALGPIVNQANGWKQSQWLGWIVDDYYPYVLHAQHEWLYTQPQGSWMWLYDYGLGEWFATSSGSYPFMYEAEGNSWMWYYEEYQNPRWYLDVQTGSVYRDYRGALMPNEMVGIMSQAENLTSGENEVVDALSETMGVVLMSFLLNMDSECPVITRVPADLNLETLPENFSVSVDFGAGCIPGESEAVMSGLLQLNVNDFLLSDTGANLNFIMEAINLTGDDELLLDGSITGDLSAVMGTTLTLNASLNFNNLQSLDTILGGAYTIEGTVGNIDTFEDMAFTIGMSNVNAGEYLINTGTLTIDAPDQSLITLSMVADTTDGPIDIALVIAMDENEVVTMNTDGVGTVLGHTIEITGMTMDPMICEAYPVAGSIRINYEGKNFRITFDDSCDGSYQMQKGG